MAGDKLERFMRGRYGQDELNRVLSGTALALCVVSLLIRQPLLSSLSMALIIICFFRAFSKNTGARFREAESYFRLKAKALGLFSGLASRVRGGMSHRVFSCPSCGQRCRVPKGQGKVRITCKRCGAKFIKKA
jgi:hypothetical protein